MKRSRWLGVLVVLLLLASSLAIVGAGPRAASKQEGMARKIVIFQDGALSEAAREALVREFGGVVTKHLRLVNGMAVLLPPRAEEALVQRSEVTRVDDDLVVHARPRPENPGKPPKATPTPAPAPPPEDIPWGVDRIDAELAWAITQGGLVKVAVVDSGIDLDHPDLKVWGGVNTINPRKSYNDDYGHGTHVAGTIAALDNDIGVVGVAPEAKLYAVKVLNRSGIGFLSDVIEGLQWAIDNGMQVVNMSIGGGGNETYHDAIIAVYNAGITIVAAAGNDGPSEDTVTYPAKYPETIAVSAIDQSDTIAGFSSRGPEVDLAAPGVNVNSTWNDGGYKEGSGTSMATPHVAGTAALVIASGRATDTNNNDRINDEIRTLLQTTADDLGATGTDNLYGYGLVDAEEAATGTQTNP